MIIIQDDFITDQEVEKLLFYFNKNKEKCQNWHGTLTLELDSSFSELGYKINNYVAVRYNACVDWGKLVHWPKDSYQPLHIDDASSKTILSSIIYLNDNYEGGQTYLEDKTIFSPKKKRAVIFNGSKYKHGVLPVIEGDRYTLAIWYKEIEKKNDS